jgi:diguanylate cyclase (GGDEF)-like protein
MEQVTIAQLSRMALLASDSQELFRWTASRLIELFQADYCQIFERNGSDAELVLRTEVGWPEDPAERRQLQAEILAQAGAALSALQPLDDGSQEAPPAHHESQPVRVEHGKLATANILIRGSQGPFGILSIQRRSGKEFTHEDVQFLRSVANLLTASIERLRKESELRRSYALNRAVVSAFPAHLVVIDGSGKVLAINRSWDEFIAGDRSSVHAHLSVGSDYLKLCERATEAAEEGAGRALVGVREVLKGERKTFVSEYRHPTATHPHWLVLRIVPLGDPQSGALIVHEDITERRQLSERLARQVQHDALTGLPNRHLFADRLQQGLLLAKRSGTGLGVLFIDLDRFKRINDTLGHAAGDEVLRQAAHRFQEHLRQTDTLTRMGGDEFVAIVSVRHGIGDAMKVARKLLGSLRQPLVAAGQELFLSASIGISLFPEDGDNAEALLRKADSALYRAKAQSITAVQSFSTEMTVEAIERFELENHLRLATERGELALYYQPQLSLDGLKVIGLEALLRWHHPHRGVILPTTFVPLAEESDLILSVGDWVMREGCRQLVEWQLEGRPPLRLAINVSAVQFSQPDFLNRIEDCLQTTGLDPKLLDLEVTESLLLEESGRITERLQQLRQLGVGISIDDFGTGYSSLSYLQQFPLDRLKIDRRFIQRLSPDHPSSSALVRAIVGLGHSLGMQVVAEGVEKLEQLQLLRELRCDEVQGFLFATPQPVEKLWKTIRDLEGAPPG